MALDAVVLLAIVGACLQVHYWPMSGMQCVLIILMTIHGFLMCQVSTCKECGCKHIGSKPISPSGVKNGMLKLPKWKCIGH